jgi:hypothetical protein
MPDTKSGDDSHEARSGEEEETEGMEDWVYGIRTGPQ